MGGEGKQREGIVDRIQDRLQRVQEREEHTGCGDSFHTQGSAITLTARIDLYHSPSKRVATLTHPLPLARITQICIAIL